MFFESAILLAYVVTLVSETALVLAIVRLKKVGQSIIAIVLINSFTHPVALYLLHIQNAPYLLVEIGVCVVEALWYVVAFRKSAPQAILISFLANIFSILMGIALRLLLDL